MPWPVGLWSGLAATIIVMLVVGGIMRRMLPFTGSLAWELFNPLDMRWGGLGSFVFVLLLTAIAKAIDSVELEKVARALSVIWVMWLGFHGWAVEHSFDPASFIGPFLVAVVAWVMLDRLSDALAIWMAQWAHTLVCDGLPWDLGPKILPDSCFFSKPSD